MSSVLRLSATQQAAVQALLLLCCLACVHCQFSYMIGPSSYLDVVRTPSGSYSSSRDANTTDEALQQQGRTLLQATRFQKPYNVCVSDWLPMVMCKPDDDHTTFTGEAFAAAQTAARRTRKASTAMYGRVFNSSAPAA